MCVLNLLQPIEQKSTYIITKNKQATPFYMNNSISKILIVDDNTFYLSLLKTVLKDVEAQVFMANSGREALSLINQNDFALAILDIQMPEMDGFELASHIRNLQNRDLIPIIFLTAYFSDDFQMFKGYDYGAIDYLTKPINKTIFLSKVKIFLELDRQKRELIASKESLIKSKTELEIRQEKIKFQNKALQKAKIESERARKKYTKLYDFAPTGYCTIKRDGKIIEINIKGAEILSNNEPSELINRNIKDFLNNQAISTISNFLSNLYENKTSNGCEITIQRNSNKPFHIFLEGALIDENQKCLLAMMDITERKEAQIALKESEELYHSLLKTSPDGIIITDLDGKIIEASDIAIELLGDVNKSRIEGTHLIQFVPRSSKRALVKICRTTEKEGMIQNFEIKLKRLDNTEFTGEISSSLIKSNNGELKAFMSVIRDISDRKMFEKQLRHSERMTAIGELATGMAHEINQPLNTISLAIDNIAYSLDSQTLSEAYLRTKINKVFDNITRIKKIIEHVRTFSRDQDDFLQSTFEINNSIRNSISMVSEHMLHKEINLAFTPDNAIPPVIGNAYRFEQVILNLLINAKDAIDEKKRKYNMDFDKKINISTKSIDDKIIIEIKDNGIGIKPEEIDKVLLPFYTTKAPGKGTGLGLSISYGIIKELDGHIDIQSTPMEGTIIQITIPVHQSRNKQKHAKLI